MGREAWGRRGGAAEEELAEFNVAKEDMVEFKD